ncbi:proline-rich protein 2-like [Antechinus flavipes]|uniref:proline-rich protein 2-like n=1 Tax=Antechinus flavipes TaxID=38775 RepID=UPI0022367509|nr:proline-rich protein 2-like [Antechinus flavipes]
MPPLEVTILGGGVEGFPSQSGPRPPSPSPTPGQMEDPSGLEMPSLAAGTPKPFQEGTADSGRPLGSALGDAGGEGDPAPNTAVRPKAARGSQGERERPPAPFVRPEIHPPHKKGRSGRQGRAIPVDGDSVRRGNSRQGRELASAGAETGRGGAPGARTEPSARGEKARTGRASRPKQQPEGPHRESPQTQTAARRPAQDSPPTQTAARRPAQGQPLDPNSSPKARTGRAPRPKQQPEGPDRDSPQTQTAAPRPGQGQPPDPNSSPKARTGRAPRPKQQPQGPDRESPQTQTAARRPAQGEPGLTGARAASGRGVPSPLPSISLLRLPFPSLISRSPGSAFLQAPEAGLPVLSVFQPLHPLCLRVDTISRFLPVLRTSTTWDCVCVQTPTSDSGGHASGPRTPLRSSSRPRRPVLEPTPASHGPGGPAPPVPEPPGLWGPAPGHTGF